MWTTKIKPFNSDSLPGSGSDSLAGGDMATLKPLGRCEPIKKKTEKIDKTCNKMTKEWSGYIEKTAHKGETNGAVCLIQHSPYRILKIAAKGDMPEFEKLYKADPTRLHIQDKRGLGVIHHAATKGKTAIMEYALKLGAEIDARDIRENTPLHTAVESKQLESIIFLVENGSNTAARNNKQLTPLILAIDLSLVEVVKTMLELDKVNPEEAGENGSRPLHYCALKDESDCAALLLSRGAQLNSKCHNAFYPIHSAAYHASTKTLTLFIQHADLNGFTSSKLLTLMDKEGNSPLHAAVTSGDLETVRVCLTANASVKAQQEEKLTPVHFAASQGTLEILELMFELDPIGMKKAVNIKDSLGMTPLHKAAIFNHENIAKSLLDHGADIDSEDNMARTPLMTASAKGGWNTVRYLIERGASIHHKDEKSRNFLHLAIRNGGRLHQFGYDLIVNVKNLLNEKDDLGCTPLHYASKEGYLSATDDLIGLGAMLNPKNNQRQSPFHFAARYGRYNTCLRLLDSEQGSNIINEADNMGFTALHIAAENGHTKVLSLLLQRGAAIQKSHHGDTPLHLAAANAYTKSMRLLLSVHANLLDCKNKDEDTALHMAAKHGHVAPIILLLTLDTKMETNLEGMTFFDYILDNRNTEAAMAVVTHGRWNEVLGLTSNKYTCSMNGLIQQLPEITLVVLDKCQTYSEHDHKDKDFHIIYNFQHLSCPRSEDDKENKWFNQDSQMNAVYAMVKFGRVDCLSHPVCVNFLQMKWDGCGMWFHVIYLGIYMVFLGLLTNFAINHRPLKGTSIAISSRGFDNSTSPPEEGNKAECTIQYQSSLLSDMNMYFLLVFSGLNAIKDVFRMIQQKERFFGELSNVMGCILYVLTFVFILPFQLGECGEFQFEAGTLAIFFAWFNLLHYLQRFDFFGIYVVMFLAILSTLLQVLCVFSILIIAFGLAFYMLMAEEATKAYSTPGLSLLRTAMMMLELDYMESFNSPYTDDDPNSLHFNNLTLFMLVIFVLLMPILLMNLLIGLAVGDIEAVQRDARLKRLAMQVEHHDELERTLPRRILQMVDKVEYKVYPNKGRHLLRNLLMKVTSSSDNGTSTTEKMLPGVTQSNINEELSKHKNKLREITNILNKQHDLLRLMVHKMDIDSAEDYRDEGDSGNDVIEGLKGCYSSPPLNPRSNWNRSSVIKKSAVLTRWKSLTKN